MRIDIDALTQALNSNLGRLSSQAGSCQQQIATLCSVAADDSLCDSEAYRGFYSYLQQVKVPVLMQHVVFIDALSTDIGTDLSRLSELGSGVVDTDELQGDIDALNRNTQSLHEWQTANEQSTPEATEAVNHLIENNNARVSDLTERLNLVLSYLGDGSIYAASGTEEGLLRKAEDALGNVSYDPSTGTFDLSGITDWSWRSPSLALKYSKACLNLLPDEKKSASAALKFYLGMDPSSCAFGGDPVNLSTGNFVYQQEYLLTPGVFPLAFSLFYNSSSGEATTVGRGWRHSLQISLSCAIDKATLRMADGHAEDFVRVGHMFVQADGKADTLLRSEGRFVYTTAQGMRHSFDEGGRLTSMRDRNDNGVDLSYDAAGRLTQAACTTGALLRYAYDEAGRLTRVTDAGGRVVTLSYERRAHDGRDSSLLNEVSDEQGVLLRLAYDTAGRVCQVSDGRRVTILENRYDSIGRVANQAFADGSTVEYTYDDDARVVRLVERDGSELSYRYDRRWRTTAIQDSSGIQHFDYNDRGQRTRFVDRRGQEFSYEYDERGNLVRGLNPLGEGVRLSYNDLNLPTSLSLCGRELLRDEYDARGNLVSSTDALGRRTSLSYESRGLPVRLTYPDGSEVTVTYDSHGNVSSVRDTRGALTRYERDETGHVLASIDANGNRTAYGYDARGNLTRLTNAQGDVRTYEYDKAGNVVRVIDFDGGVVTYEYDVTGRLTRTIDQAGNAVTLDYDAMGRVMRRTDARGAQTTYTYDRSGNLELVTDPLGSQTRYRYDPNGNCIRSEAPDGSTRRATYDALNRLVCVQDESGAATRAWYDHFGNVKRIVDPLGYERTWNYDAMGQLVGMVDELGNEILLRRNELGLVREEVNAAGGVTRHEYLPGGALARTIHPDGTYETYDYDANGNVVRRKRQDGYALSYVYDCLNRIVRIESSEGQTLSYAYDAVGNVVSLTDALGNMTRYSYSPTGQLVCVTDALGNRTSFSHDETDSLVEVRQLSEAQSLNERPAAPSRITRYDRDELGRVTRVVDGAGHEEAYTYDACGRLASKLDADGFVTTYAHDGRGLLTGVSYADGKAVRLSYDALRRLEEVEDWLGTMSIETDAAGHVRHIRDQRGSEVSYSHGPCGERRSLSYPGGRSVSYEYDEALRLVAVHSDGLCASYGYDENGRLASRSLSQGVRTDYEYGPTGALAHLTHRDERGALDEFSFDYDLQGNRIGMDVRRRGLDDASGSYAYSYDALNRLVDVGKDGGSLRSYAYDAFGNRTRMDECGRGRVTYTYDASNRLVRSEGANGTFDYSYDRRGNLTQVREDGVATHAYEYGPMNLLLASWNRQGQATTYDYDGRGQRVGKRLFEGVPTGASVTDAIGDLNPVCSTGYVLDQTRRYHNLLQRTGNDATHDVLWGDEDLLADMDDAARMHVYLQDNLGSVLRYLDPAGEGGHTEAYAYDEFGRDLLGNQGMCQPFGYTGYQADSVAGTCFAQAREYLPDYGRFASRDTIKGFASDPRTLNEYTYCWNTPLDLVDLTGAFPSWSDVKDWWNTHVYGAETVTQSTSTTEPASAFFGGGGYTSSSMSTTVQDPNHTGSIIKKTTTLDPTGKASVGWSLNIPSLDLGNGSALGIPTSIGGSFGKSGLNINVSTGLDIWKLKVGANLSEGIGPKGRNADINLAGGWANDMLGIGIGVPGPLDKLKGYAFHSATSGNTTVRDEYGAYVGMGWVYLAAAAAAAVALAAPAVASAGAILSPAFLLLFVCTKGG